jgi:hypothetical protein
MYTISTHESITSGSYQIQIPPNDYLFVISKFNIKKTNQLSLYQCLINR